MEPGGAARHLVPLLHHRLQLSPVLGVVIQPLVLLRVLQSAVGAAGRSRDRGSSDSELPHPGGGRVADAGRVLRHLRLHGLPRARAARGDDRRCHGWGESGRPARADVQRRGDLGHLGHLRAVCGLDLAGRDGGMVLPVQHGALRSDGPRADAPGVRRGPAVHPGSLQADRHLPDVCRPALGSRQEPGGGHVHRAGVHV